MERLEELVATLPEAVRVDIENWGGKPARGCSTSIRERDHG